MRAGLAQHRGLRFDAAHAPRNDTDAVDHRRVRVGADHSIRIRRALLVDEHHRSQVLQVHLVHNARIRRNRAEILERRLPPAKEAVALLIALEFEQRVLLKRLRRAEVVHLHGVVDDQVHRNQRVRFLRVSAQLGERVTHSSEIDDARHTGEVLQNNARNQQQTTFQIDQPIELGGKRSARIAAGEAGIAAAQARNRDGRLLFATELARAYASAEVAERRIALAEDEVEEATADLKVE